MRNKELPEDKQQLIAGTSRQRSKRIIFCSLQVWVLVATGCAEPAWKLSTTTVWLFHFPPLPGLLEISVSVKQGI